MIKMDEIQKRILQEVADLHETPIGAYNFRVNGKSIGRNSTSQIVCLRYRTRGRMRPISFFFRLLREISKALLMGLISLMISQCLDFHIKGMKRRADIVFIV